MNNRGNIGGLFVLVLFIAFCLLTFSAFGWTGLAVGLIMLIATGALGFGAIYLFIVTVVLAAAQLGVITLPFGGG